MRYVPTIGAGVVVAVVAALTILGHNRASEGPLAWADLPESLQDYIRYVDRIRALDVRGLRLSERRLLGTPQEVAALAARVFTPRRAQIQSRFAGRRRDPRLDKALRELEAKEKDYIALRAVPSPVSATPFTVRILNDEERLDIGNPGSKTLDGSARMSRQTRIYRQWMLSDLSTFVDPDTHSLAWPGPDLRHMSGHLTHLSLAAVIRRWKMAGSSPTPEGQRYEFTRPAKTDSLPGSFKDCTKVVAVFSEVHGMPVRIELFGEEGLRAVAQIEDYDGGADGRVKWPQRVIWSSYDEGLKAGERTVVSTMEIEYHLVEINGEIPEWIFEDPQLAEPDEELFPTFAFEGAAG